MKKQIIQALEPFDDEDNLVIGDTAYLGAIRRVCGKGQHGMAYVCRLPPGHTGRCLCFYKNTLFTPDTISWEQFCKETA